MITWLFAKRHFTMETEKSCKRVDFIGGVGLQQGMPDDNWVATYVNM